MLDNKNPQKQTHIRSFCVIPDLQGLMMVVITLMMLMTVIISMAEAVKTGKMKNFIFEMALLNCHCFLPFFFCPFLHWQRRRQWHPTPVLLPGESRGQRSLEGCGPWGGWGSDTTERLYFHFSLLCIGEGNGNPLQCSCLENPRDAGAWWAAVYGVTQSRTRLKWLSSSSSSSSSIGNNRESQIISNYIMFLDTGSHMFNPVLNQAVMTYSFVHIGCKVL